MGTIRLQRAEGEYADVPQGTSDEAALRALGFKDLAEESGAALPPWPLKTSPAEYLEQQAGVEEHSGLVLARMELARQHIAASALG